MRRSRGGLGKIDLNVDSLPLPIETHWCRIVDDTPDSHNYNNQKHSFFELHIPLGGECEIELDGECYTLSFWKYLLLPPYRSHRLRRASEDFSKLVWGFSLKEQCLSDKLSEGCNSEWPRPLSKWLSYSLERLITEADNSTGFRSYALIKSALDSVLTYIIRDLTDLRSDEKNVKKSHAIMDEMCRFIRENLSARVGLRETSAWLYISERHLERLCHSEHSISFGEIKRSIQYERIRDLLVNSEFNLAEIAKESGFSDEYAMSKFFKRRTGTTPAAYRKSTKSTMS